MSDVRLDAIAKELELDMAAFKRIRVSKDAQVQVEADTFLASTANIDGTPSFLINGRLVVGAVPFANFQTVIGAELAKVDVKINEGKSVMQARGEVSEFNMKKTLAPDGGGVESLIKVDIEGAPGKGAKDPLVAIVEFSDFQ